MQRSMSIAKEAGVSFEWLGAMIAQISESTRLSAETIGRALASVFSRLQSIKERGFNEDDDTKINDVAKALEKANIAIMQGGKWRSFTDILDELAGKWTDLDDKTKAYITTTMAGTQQRDRLLTLLNDMSKGVEGESRAYYLYAEALEAAGASQEKYEIYMDTVQAAQDDYRNSLEHLYATFMSGNVMKDFYGLLTDLVDAFDRGMEATDGLTLKIPALVAGFVGLYNIVTKVGPAISGLLQGTLSFGGFGVILSMLGLVAGGITMIAGAATETKKSLAELTKEHDALTSKYAGQLSAIANLRDEYETLSGKTELTTAEQERLQTVLNSIAQLSPQLRSEIQLTSGEWRDQTKVVAALAGEYARLSDEMAAMVRAKAIDVFEAGESEIGKTLKISEAKQGLLELHQLFEDARSFDPDFYGVAKDTQLADYLYNQIALMYPVLWNETERFEEELGKNNPVAKYVNTLYGKGIINETLFMAFWDDLYKTLLDAGYDVQRKSLPEEQQLFNTMLEAIDFDVAAMQNETRAKITSSLHAFTQLPGASEWEPEIQKQVNSFFGAYIKALEGLDNKTLLETLKSSTDILPALTESFTDIMNQFPALPGIQSTIGEVFTQMLDGFDPSIDIKPQIDSMLTQLSDAFENAELTDKISNLYRKLEVNTDLLTDEQKVKWEADVREMLRIINELLEAMNLPAIEMPSLIQPDVGTMELGAFSVPDQSKLIEEAQKAANALVVEKAALSGFRAELQAFQQAMNSNDLLFYWQSLTEEMRSGMLKAYPELSNIIVMLDDGELSAAEMAEAVEHLTDALDKSSKVAQQASFDKYKDAASIISNINTALDKLSDAKTAKLFGTSDLDSLVGQFPELLTMLGNQAALEEYLIELKNDQADAQATAYNDMLMHSESYFQYLKSSNGELYQLLSELYGDDAKNFKTLADAKAKIDEILIANLGAAWQSHFNSIGAAMAAASAAAKQSVASAKAQMSEIESSAAWGSVGALRKYDELTIKADKATNQIAQLDALSNLGTMLDGISSSFKDINFSAPKISAGGGGGGSKGKSEADKMMDEITRMLDIMEQLTAIRNFERELNNLHQTYYKNRGELTNYISAMQDELQLLKRNNAAEEENLHVLEQKMAAKKAEIASLSYGTEAYDKANEALDKLQSAHQDYTKSLMQNKIDVDALTEAIKEQERAIRQQQIDIRNLIEKAIRDREALYESMLKAEIQMEKEILAALTKRYEQERDLILDNIKARIKALQDEKRAIDDNLRKRKEEDEWAKKQAKLIELQEQYARISADPTRQREALTIQQQIIALREEMAWYLAEQEAQAQKDAIDQQITSLEDYMAYVKKHYDDIFQYPEALIAEMRRIVEQTDDQIIAWLKENSEEYKNSSERVQEDMVRTWQSTLHDMRGHIVTYWDEVENIIAQGDEAIIQFLMDNSADYRAAGALQAQAYVDEWQRKLDQLKAAALSTYQQIQSYNYAVTQTGTSSGSSSGSGGGSGGGSSSGAQFVASGTGYAEATKSTAVSLASGGTTYVKDPKSSYWYKQADAKSIDGGRTYYWATGSTRYIKKYAKGGLVNYTGLAMVHGTEKEPEAFLNAEQTKIIKGLAVSLQTASKVQVPALPGITAPALSCDDIRITFGDVIVSVQKLDVDADYDAMAEKLQQAIATKLRGGKAVGGMFFGRG